MSGQSNFQDLIGLSGSTISMGIEALIVGTDNANKSIIFAQDPAQASALFVAATNPSGDQTLVIPAANGTVGLVTQLEFAGTSISNGTISIANTSGVLWGVNGNTVTAALSRISGITVNDFAGTFALVSSYTTAVDQEAPTFTFSTGNNSAIRMGAIPPVNVSYMDPGGQNNLSIIAVCENGTLSVGASASWWMGIYTMSGSTASVVSSTSNSSGFSFTVSTTGSVTSQSSINLDDRFTNLAWNFTLGDYLCLIGTTFSATVSYTGNLIVGQGFSASLNQTAFGASRAQVSYSVPYFPDGTVSASLGSYQLSQIIQSGGIAVTTLAPRLEFIGS